MEKQVELLLEESYTHIHDREELEGILNQLNYTIKNM